MCESSKTQSPTQGLSPVTGGKTGRSQGACLLFFYWFQFEYMAQHLVFANCIPLILKFFNQNIMSYITAKNR